MYPPSPSLAQVRGLVEARGPRLAVVFLTFSVCLRKPPPPPLAHLRVDAMGMGPNACSPAVRCSQPLLRPILCWLLSVRLTVNDNSCAQVLAVLQDLGACAPGFHSA